MTREEKRRWLNRYRDAEIRIRSLYAQRDELLEMMVHITPSLTGMPSSGNSGSDKIPKAYEKLESLNLRLANEICTLQIVQDEIRAAIDTLEDGRLRNVLLLHFVNGYSFELTADIMHYSLRHIFELYDAATDKVRIESHN